MMTNHHLTRLASCKLNACYSTMCRVQMVTTSPLDPLDLFKTHHTILIIYHLSHLHDYLSFYLFDPLWFTPWGPILKAFVLSPIGYPLINTIIWPVMTYAMGSFIHKFLVQSQHVTSLNFRCFDPSHGFHHESHFNITILLIVSFLEKFIINQTHSTT